MRVGGRRQVRLASACGLDNRASSAEQADQQQHDGNDQQDVHERTDGVGPDRERHLPFDVLAEIFNRLSDLAPTAPERLFDITSGFVCDAFIAELLVVGEIGPGLLCLTLQLVGLPLEFVLVLHGLPPLLKEHSVCLLLLSTKSGENPRIHVAEAAPTSTI